MGRQSLNSARIALNALMAEQNRDREALQRMANHCTRMIETLQSMREQEEERIDAEAAERKSALRKMFDDLVAFEEERRDRLSAHISDLNGDLSLDDDLPVDGHNGATAQHEVPRTNGMGDRGEQQA
jgi:hypothetical protein